jgi:hypothetical protein
MASTNTAPKSKNRDWGFYGTIDHHGDPDGDPDTHTGLDAHAEPHVSDVLGASGDATHGPAVHHELSDLHPAGDHHGAELRVRFLGRGICTRRFRVGRRVERRPDHLAAAVAVRRLIRPRGTWLARIT